MDTLADLFAANAPYTRPGPLQFNTPLHPLQEQTFRQWLVANQVPFNPDAVVTDYDMRGFWQALQHGDPRAVAAVNQNDGRLHYPDYWKTPGHVTFSAESQFAGPMAPRWDERDRLIAPSGRILFDERAQPAALMGGLARLFVD